MVSLMGCLWGFPMYTAFGYSVVFGTRDVAVDQWHLGNAWCNVTLSDGQIDVKRCLKSGNSSGTAKEVDVADNGGKSCASSRGTRFLGHYVDFWIGRDPELPLYMRWPDANGLAPVYVDQDHHVPEYAVDDLFSARCRSECLVVAACGKWTFRIRRDHVGGRSYFFDMGAHVAPYNPYFIGGGCEQMHTEWIRCEPYMHGRWRNVAPVYEQPRFELWNETMGPWNVSSGNDIWCGLLPASFTSWWYYTAQMVIFTVYMNTGTTTKFAWQGVIGTVGALANVYFMECIYPYGGEKVRCTVDDDEDECDNGGLKYRSPNYREDLVKLDVVIVYLLVLLSGAEEITIKFMGSWHFTVMMRFMDPTTHHSSGTGTFDGANEIIPLRCFHIWAEHVYVWYVFELF